VFLDSCVKCGACTDKCHYYLGTADPKALHGWFEGLAKGGTVLDPLAPKPWGAVDGQVVDRHGLRWLIGYEPAS